MARHAQTQIQITLTFAVSSAGQDSGRKQAARRWATLAGNR